MGGNGEGSEEKAKRGDAASREERLARQLRENLRRRKAQARAQMAVPADDQAKDAG